MVEGFILDFAKLNNRLTIISKTHMSRERMSREAVIYHCIPAGDFAIIDKVLTLLFGGMPNECYFCKFCKLVHEIR